MQLRSAKALCRSTVCKLGDLIKFTYLYLGFSQEHLKSIIVSIVKQRRPFRMRDKRILHSIGVPYPNPYLRQGFHMYDDPYG